MNVALSSTGRAGRGRRGRRGRRAFSLVELLVVIGILAVLVGLLLPSLSAARRQAKLVQCMSNMRQVGNAALMRAHERGGFLPLAGSISVNTGTDTDVGRVPRGLRDPNRIRYIYSRSSPTGGYDVPAPWTAALAPFLDPTFVVPTEDSDSTEAALNLSGKLWRFFQCPATDSYDRETYLYGTRRLPLGQGTLISLRTNGSLLFIWSSNTDYVFNEALLGFHSDPVWIRLRGQTARMKDPARLVLMTDGNRRTALPEPVGFPGFKDGWQVWTPKVNEYGLPLSGALEKPSRVNDAASFDRRRHRGKVNVIFVDGHAETRKIDEPSLRDVYVTPPSK